MHDSGWKRPSPALVVSFIALLVAMSGTAVAVKRNAVGSKELARDAVKSRHVDKGAVRGKELSKDAIKGRHVKSETLKSKHLEDGQAVSGADVIDDSLTGDDIAQNAVGSAKVADDSLTGADIDESTLGKVGDADALDGLDSSELVRGGGEHLIDIAFLQSEGDPLDEVTEADEGKLELGCTDAEGATVQYTSLENILFFKQRVWTDPGDLGPPTLDAIDFNDSAGRIEALDTVAHIRIQVDGASFAHTYDVFVRHDDAAANECRYALTKRTT
ncbi:MAG TPA: hypothetical protein VKA36_02710 [Solirubrobacterales bacterium]|nr:hypothetical protein [Solirubrobacterales bacterium]